MNLDFFKKIFGEKLITDFEGEINKMKKSWSEHLDKDGKEHEKILKSLKEIKNKLGIEEKPPEEK